MLVAFVFAIAAKADVSHTDFLSTILQQLFIPTVAALVALVIGVSSLGDEREDGTVLYLVATPIPRLNLIVTKVAAAWVCVDGAADPEPGASTALIMGGSLQTGMIVWPALGVVLACLAYCGASVWLSLRVRRPVVVGVLYILLWEGSIATFAASAGKLSIAALRQVARRPRAAPGQAPRGGARYVGGCARGRDRVGVLVRREAALPRRASVVAVERRSPVEPAYRHRQHVVQGVDFGRVWIVQRIDPAGQGGVVGGELCPLCAGGAGAGALHRLLSGRLDPSREAGASA